MYKPLKVLILSSLTIAMSSCILFDNGSDNIVDGYEVSWIDLHQNRAVYSKNEQLVPPYVFAVGHNANYIFAKQYPLLEDSDEIIDKSTVNFFIIKRTKGKQQSKIIFGPLTKNNFESMCKNLGINDPEFNLTYPTNLKF